jgi:hypothetical protein
VLIIVLELPQITVRCPFNSDIRKLGIKSIWTACVSNNCAKLQHYTMNHASMMTEIICIFASLPTIHLIIRYHAIFPVKLHMSVTEHGSCLNGTKSVIIIGGELKGTGLETSGSISNIFYNLNPHNAWGIGGRHLH